MATNTKTKKEYFEEIREKVINDIDLVNFIDRQLMLLERKANSSTQIKINKENEAFKAIIIDILMEFEEYATVKQIQAKNETLQGLSTQKIVALLTQLKSAEQVEKTEIKKIMYYRIASV